MPHVIVKLWPGKTEQQKQRLSDAIVDAVTAVLNYGDESVSVSIEEVPQQQWKADVYDPDTKCKSDTLYKKPGYRM